MKFFSFNRNNTAIFITLLFVLSFGSFYFFIYVPYTEKDLQQQRFRSLQTIEENIQAKRRNSTELINILLKDSVSTKYINFLADKSKDLFILSSRKTDTGRFVNDTGYSIKVNNANRRILLEKIKPLTTAKAKSGNSQISITWTFRQFIESLLPKNVFDEYIVFNEGEVIYETFPSGITYLKDSLTDKNRGIVTAGVTALKISGTEYKMFLQPLRFGSNKWVIAGLLSNNRYQQERSRLPASVVIFLVTVLLIILVVFPWIKLYQMGNKDRLTLTDGIASIVVSMLLMSLLFFTFFKYNTILRPDNYTPNSKDTIASQVTKAFIDEISIVYQKLSLFNDIAKSQPKLLEKNIINLDKDNISFANSADTISFSEKNTNPALKTLTEISKNISINQVFWLDENGDEKVNWTSGGMNAPHGSYKRREYFKKIIQGKAYIADWDSSRKFYLDQVISWVSGTFTSVLSIPSGIAEKPVAAISIKLNSLTRPVLPLGYQFAIIDNAGKVLYHSDSARNLNQNLISEFSESGYLVSSLQAGTKNTFTTNYFSKEYKVSVRPVEKMPYYIVVFEDSSYKETKDMETYSFTFSMSVLFFGFLIFQLFVVFLVSSQQSVLKNQLFKTSWIALKKHSHHEYNLSVLANVSIILLALCFYHLSTFLLYLFILLFSVTFISIFLNVLFAWKYNKEKQADNHKFKISTIFWLFIFVIIIDIAALRILDIKNIWLLLLYELIAGIIGCFFLSLGPGIFAIIKRHTNKNLLRKWDYKRSFTLMALTRLIITSGLPVAFFYITSYDYEQNISIRYRQLQYADSLLEKLNDNQLDTIGFKNKTTAGFYYDGALIKDISTLNTGITNAKQNVPSQYSLEEEITAKLLGLFRVNITDISVKEANFFTPHGTDTSFFFNPLLKAACKNDSATQTYRQTRVPGQYLKITASGLNYQLPSVFSNFPLSGLLFWTLFIVALITFYFIIYKIVCKLFCLGLPDLSVWGELEDKLITDPNLNKRLFIIGLPGSGILQIILGKIKECKLNHGGEPLVYNEQNEASGNVFIVDIANISDSGIDRKSGENLADRLDKISKDSNQLIIFNNFEYNISDTAYSQEKLKLLQHLTYPGKCRIIILSTKHPATYTDLFTDQSIKETEKSGFSQQLEKWILFLQEFNVIIYPLKKWEFHTGKISSFDYTKTFEEIYEETKFTDFLGKIHQHAIYKNLKGLENEKADRYADELALKLEVTAHYFYMSIWQSFSKEEKFLLYDLAEDNLVNSYDDYNLTMLLAKGVIIRPEGPLKLFNKGFRNFILTSISNNEATKIQNTIKDNGNWNRLKTPLLIVVLAILAFLLTSQQETYSKLLAYVAALATGIPTILRLFSIFDNKSEQKAS